MQLKNQNREIASLKSENSAQEALILMHQHQIEKQQMETLSLKNAVCKVNPSAKICLANKK